MDALSALWKFTCRLPALTALTSEGLNAVPKKVGPFTSKSVPLQVPVDPVLPLGIAQVETYHFGLPLAS